VYVFKTLAALPSEAPTSLQEHPPVKKSRFRAEKEAVHSRHAAQQTHHGARGGSPPSGLDDIIDGICINKSFTISYIRIKMDIKFFFVPCTFW